MEPYEKQLIELSETSRSICRRLDRLESTTAAVQELATSVKLLAQNMEHMAQEQADQGQRLKTLEAQDGQKWNNMTRTVFTSAVSTLSGGLLGALVTLLIQ